MPIWITLAVEDRLSEAVVRKILAHCSPSFEVSQCLGRKGCGYLKKRIRNFNKAAKELPIFVLTDLDNPEDCAPERVRSWLGSQPQEHNLLFRIAVMEVESWLLAHRAAIADFLMVPLNRIPMNTDGIREPKEFLVGLARKSRSRRLREDLVPQRGASSPVGADYNGRLAEFVRARWNADTASQCSASLKRTLIRVRDYARRVNP